MVKRIITISALFSLLIILAFYELVAVNNLITTLNEQATNLQTEIYENKEFVSNSINSVKKTKEYWNKNEIVLTLMFNHKDLSTITDTLSRLYSYVENNDFDNAIAEVNLLKQYSEKNKWIMGFNFQNIL